MFIVDFVYFLVVLDGLLLVCCVVWLGLPILVLILFYCCSYLGCGSFCYLGLWVFVYFVLICVVGWWVVCGLFPYLLCLISVMCYCWFSVLKALWWFAVLVFVYVVLCWDSALVGLFARWFCLRLLFVY